MEEYDGKMDLKELLLGVDWVYLAQDNTWGGGGDVLLPKRK